MIINKFIPATAIFLCIALYGCGQPSVVGSTPSSGNTTNLSFSKVTTATELALNILIASINKSSGSSLSTPSLPQTGAPLPTTGTAPSGSSGGVSASYPTYYNNYFPKYGNFDQYVVINYEEAKRDGFKGTFQTVLNQVVKPIIDSLASDSRLVSSNGNTDDTGTNITTGSDQLVNGYSTNLWQFTYVSASKKEVYNILVSDKETLVLKQTWGILNLNPNDVKIDSASAIKIVKDAVKNKDFKLPNNSPVTSANTQVLYDLPDNTNWYFYLSSDKGTLVWNINFNLPYPTLTGVVASPPATTGSSGSGTTTTTSSPAGTVAPVSPYYFGGYAQIDAKTGNIISLTRPMNYGNAYSVLPVPSPATGK